MDVNIKTEEGRLPTGVYGYWVYNAYDTRYPTFIFITNLTCINTLNYMGAEKIVSIKNDNTP